MEFIAAALIIYIYVYLARRFYRWVCTKTQKNALRLLTLVSIIALFFVDNIIGNSIYYYLIKVRSGERIYEKPGKVQGYMIEDDWGGIIEYYAKDLFNERYKYLELKVNSNSKSAYYAKNKGLYRFYVSRKGDDLCKDYWHAMQEDYINRGRPLPFPTDKCLAYTPVSKPASRYVVRLEEKKEYLYNVKLNSVTISDIETGKLLAELSKVYYLGGFLRVGMFLGRSFEAYPDASIDHDHELKTNFIHNVL